MRFTYIHIKNFKSISSMEISDIENALILVGKNNTGKTTVLDAIRAVTGGYEIWERDFYKKLPSYKEGRLTFTYRANRDGRRRYEDGIKKDNPHIPGILPKLHYIDTGRVLKDFQNDLLFSGDNRLMERMRSGSCLFDRSRICRHCFQCIGLINQKKPETLDAAETMKLLEYKLYQLHMSGLADRINENFHKNGGYEEIIYELQCDVDRMFQISAEAYNSGRRR